MIKINFKFITALIYVISIIYIFEIRSSLAGTTENKYIIGRVVYSDDKSPVTEGMVKVFKVNLIDGKGRIIETTEIDQSGSFKLTNPIILQQTDGIKIMAYPNDYDNIEAPFHPAVMEIGNVKNYALTIEVERAADNELKQSAGENRISLKQNFPNPFNPSTLIRFDLPFESNVTLKVYNMNGEAIATLIDNKKLTTGLKEYEFDASSFPSGIYVYSLNAGSYVETRKMMLLK